MDFIKAALLEEKRLELAMGRNMDELPGTPVSDCVTALVNEAFSTGEVAKCWEESALVPIPKRGDLADPDNYRGISLMATTLN